MMLGLAISGLAALIGLAWIVGSIDARARNGAWNRIAAARRQQSLKEQRLLECLDGPRCADCPLGRYFRDQYGG